VNHWSCHYPGKKTSTGSDRSTELFFDQAEEFEDVGTLQPLEIARRGEGRPAKEVPEEIRLILGTPVNANCPAQ
jgi:hypothetical protein